MRKGTVSLVALSALLAGCGDGVAGSPIAAERWDPCSITRESLAATGLDPDYRYVGWGSGLDQPEWGRCVFRAPGGFDFAYAFDVLSTIDHTISETRTRPGNIDGRDLQVGGRDAFMYRTDVGGAISECSIALDVDPGLVIFSTLYHANDGVDACQVVTNHVNDLQAVLPVGQN